MSLNQIIDLDPNSTLVCDDTLNLKGNQLRLKKKIVVPEGEFDNVDTITINNTPYPPSGLLPTAIPNKILRTNNLSVVSWGDVNPSNLTGGNVSDVLKTIAPGTVAWDPVKPVDITPGTAAQIMHTNLAGTAAEWTTDLPIPGNCGVSATLSVGGNAGFASNINVAGSSTLQSNVVCNQTLNVDGNTFCNSSLTVTNDIGVTTGNLDVLTGITTLQELDINGNLVLNGVNGTTGQVIQKTSATTQSWVTPSYPPSAITPGSANQVFVTDSLGTTAQWSNNLNLPGTLAVTSTTNLLGNLQLNGVSGSTGQYLKKTGAATQAFNNIIVGDITPGVNGQFISTVGGVSTWTTPTQVRNIVYGTSFLAQNLNAIAGPTAVSFSTSPFIDIANSTTTAVGHILQISATQFQPSTTAPYQFEFTGYIDPTSTGLGNSIITLSIEINGTEQSTGCVTCNGDYSFSGTIPGVLVSAFQTVRILVRRVVGTGSLNTFATGIVPSFYSNMVIRNMS